MAGKTEIIARRVAGWCLSLAIYACYPRALRHYVVELGKFPNIAFPSSYHEKMFWRRVFDRNPDFVKLSDKLWVKDVFRACDRQVLVAETLWTGADPEDMPASLCRPDVVVKANTGAGRNWFFAERTGARSEFVATCRRWLTRPHTRSLGEWAYSEVTPMLLAERLVAPFGEQIDEFKVHLFGGKVFYTVVYIDEGKPWSKSAIFDDNGCRLGATNSIAAKDPARRLPPDYQLPSCYSTAMGVAKAVAARFDYLRVDFMHARGLLYAGEITVYPTAGLMTNSDPHLMEEMGRCWDLRRSWFLSTPQSGWRGAYQRMLREATAEGG